MEKLPIYKLVLCDDGGIQKMSLVDQPAVEVDFLAFAKEEQLKFSVDDEQHIVFGCALRANYPIYRFSANLGEYYVVFEKDSIKQLYEDFMIKGNANRVNLEHSADTDGIYLIQSFLKDSDKGISPVGFEDVEDGSWFVSYKVNNDEVWNAVKAGKFNGFSVEGMFGFEEPTTKQDELDALLDELLN